jgi:hypothetical protein
MVEDVQVNHLTYHEVALKHRVRIGLVQRIVKSHKSHALPVEKTLMKESLRDRKLKAVIEAVQALKARGQHIWRAAQVVTEVALQAGLQVSPAYVSCVMRNYLGMRYKLVQRVAYAGNSVRS